MSKIARIFLSAAILGFAVAAAWAQTDQPIDFGRRAVAEALAARGLKAAVEIKVTGSGRPESFEIAFKDGPVQIKAADTNGALYGALELAERIRRRGADALRGPSVVNRPFLRDRGWNIFLTLPWNYAAANTDYDPRALLDPARWWFLDQLDGMTRQIEVLSNMGLLSRFVGMTTDSRNFLSYPRHDYFRRLLCDILGRDMERGRLPEDMDLAGGMVKDICYFNAKRYFRFPETRNDDAA